MSSWLLIKIRVAVIKSAFSFFIGKYKWDDGHVSGTVYHGGKDLTAYLTKVLPFSPKS